jgi:glycosyltransferase involved in cell wall biosynthesis
MAGNIWKQLSGCWKHTNRCDYIIDESDIQMETDLAVIILAYRSKYLRETLASFADQTDQAFNLYVADDASPENLQAIISEFAGRIKITFLRFESNYGAKSLTSQWARAVKAAGTEPWIWLFCDDDKCDKNCVEVFHLGLQKSDDPAAKVHRFATRIINEKSEVISAKYEHPEFESGTEFFIRKIRGETRSSLSEYIFHRDAFNEHGFQPFPLAWHSDDAAWIAFSHKNRIKTNNNAVVYFRLSEDSISGSTRHDYMKMRGAKQFVEWLLSANILEKNKISFQTWLYTYYSVETYFAKRMVPIRIADIFMLWRLRMKCVGVVDSLKIVKLAKLFLPVLKRQ